MKLTATFPVLGAAVLLAAGAPAANVGSPFYGDPPDERHPWAVHDPNRPQPKRVEPLPYDAAKARPPADAVVLFDGTAESLAQNWESDNPQGSPTKWVVKDGSMECTPGSGQIRSKQKFGDCQLHVEWAAPARVDGSGQGRGNSGIFLPGGVEIQVLDNYDNPTYADGFACSVYGVTPPLANALRPPNEFQSVDITFHRPIYKDGQCVQPGWVTVYCNGVLVQDCTELEGPTGHMSRSKPGPLPEAGALKLQDHGNPVRFRNLWYRPLPSQPAPGGVNGPLSPEATAAKRKEIAADIRADAAKLADPAKPLPQFYRLAESLCYAHDAATAAKVHQMAGEYVGGLRSLSADALTAKKDEARRMRDVLRYLTRWKILAADFAPKTDLEALIRDQAWDRKK